MRPIPNSSVISGKALKKGKRQGFKKKRGKVDQEKDVKTNTV